MAGKCPTDWRAGIRSFQVETPTKQYLHATGISAGQPRGCAFAPLGSRLRAWGTGRRPVGSEETEPFLLKEVIVQ